MAFHPPILYLGYVGFTVPFAFAVAALITGRLGEGWLTETRRATLLAWGSLTAGIVLGGWWSYEVLGWGGYWAWDPVENASLLPWLTATAYLHSVLVQERRGMLRVWNLSLVLATFALTIFGTFLTRSGVINSVHAFTQSPIGPALLGFLAVVGVVVVGLIAWRADLLRSPGRIDSPLSREGAFLGNNLLFAAFALVVLLGTVFPLVAEAYDGRQISVGEPYFDDMTLPIGFALLFLMAVAPALPWRAASTEVLHRRLAAPAWSGALTMAVAVVLGLRGVAPLATLGLGAFALAGIARQFWVGARSRRRLTAEGAVIALVRTVRSSHRLYGGLVVHTGVVVVAVAFAMSSSFTTERARWAWALESQPRWPATRSPTWDHEPRRVRQVHNFGPPPGPSGRPRAGDLRAGAVPVPRLRPGHRHAVGTHRSTRGPVPDARDRSGRRRAGGHRDADQPVGGVVVDRGRRDGGGHRSGRLARPRWPGRVPIGSCRAGSPTTATRPAPPPCSGHGAPAERAQGVDRA